MTKEETIQGLQELYDRMEDAFSLDECSAVSDAIRKLKNATIWTPCTERMPTSEDGDEYGDVNTIDHDGTTCFLQWDEVEFANNVYAWSRIETIGGGNG